MRFQVVSILYSYHFQEKKSIKKFLIFSSLLLGLGYLVISLK